jgi:hypothetical protein
MDLILRKTQDGRLEGVGERSAKNYEGWRKFVRDLPPGDTFRFSWKRARSPKFHRYFFGVLGSLFDTQEQFAEDGNLLDWIKIGAGHAVFHPGPDGRMMAIPKSIAWENLEEDDFREFVDAAWAFLRSERAGFYLWPLMTPAARSEAIERLLEDKRDDNR